MKEQKYPITYWSATMLMLQSITILSACIRRSICETIHDVVKGIMKHPIFAIILICAFISLFVSMAQARVERDNMNVRIYQYEIKNDSLTQLLNLKRHE